jgi:thiol:disulfide interchange protein DsbA
VKPGQVEVIEFYWYGCPVCFALEPYVEGWEKQLPKDVVFKRVPGAMPDSEFYVDAQATAVAEVLGIGDKIREPFFNAIHEDGNVALRTDKSAIRDFFGKFGVKPADFDAVWDSAAVKAKLAEYQKLAASYGVDRVPTIIVNGKWKTGAGYVMAPDKVMRCVEFLVNNEKAGK